MLALLDGAFAGFRSSAGRTGLIDHRAADRLAARRGCLLACALLTPVAAAACAQWWLGRDDAALTRAGLAMLMVYVPYGLIVLLALGCYSVLGWRQRYLATAVVLGPFTLARPVVAVLGGVAGAYAGRDVVVAACAGLAVVAVLAVQPVADRCWYARGSHPV